MVLVTGGQFKPGKRPGSLVMVKTGGSTLEVRMNIAVPNPAGTSWFHQLISVVVTEFRENQQEPRSVADWRPIHTWWNLEHGCFRHDGEQNLRSHISI